MTSTIKVDTISENTSANGVAVDGVTLKDGGGTFTSPVLVPDGSTSAVSLGNDGDPNTGIYFQAADSLGLVLGGSRKLSASSTGIAIENGTLSAKGGAVFNEDSADVDFRVESNGNANMLFVSGGNDVVGIGAEGDLGVGLHIKSADSGGSVNGVCDELVIENSSRSGMTILSGTSSIGTIAFGDSGSNTIGSINYDHSSNNLNFYTNGSERVRMHSGGNISIGSTSDPAKLSVTTASSGVSPSSNADELLIEGNDNAGMTIGSGTSGAGNIYFADSGDNDIGIIRYDHGDNAMLLVTNASERMRIASDGDIGIGTTDPTQNLELVVSKTASIPTNQAVGSTDNGSACGMGIHNENNSATYSGINLETRTTHASRFLIGNQWTGSYNGSLFVRARNGATSSAEIFRANSNGTFGIGTTSTSGGIFADLDRSGDYIIRAYNSNNSNPTGIFNYYSAAAPDSSGGNQFLRCQDTGAVRLDIRGDGDVLNHDNAFGSLSDERIKQDIRDSNSQWDDIKAVKIRNYKKKDDIRQYGDNAWEQIGVVAQELETVSPKLIRHNDPSSADVLSDSSFGTLYEDGDDIPEGKEIGEVKEIKEQVKSVNYSILYMKAIKALQEAMDRIETLETEVTALKNN